VESDNNTHVVKNIVGNDMVIYGKPKALKKISKKKRRPARPTQFDTQLEMAKICWAPVLECLSLLDSKMYNTVEDLPLPKNPYKLKRGKEIIEFERKNPNKKIKWISGSDIQKIHDELIETFGGEMGIADKSQLDAIIDRAKNSRIFGVDQLQTVVHKAAFLMHSLLRYHQFVDGQKRTGVSTAFIFLGLNGYSFWSRDVLEEVHYCIETAQGEHDVDDIRDWLSDRIWSLKNVSGEKEAIDRVVKISTFKGQCTNSDCRSLIHTNTYRTKCPKCGREYELKITNLITTHGINPQITYNIGLHKLEDSRLVSSGVISVEQRK
jgi:death-on-curing protein